ncbi:MAG: hypothetical protein AMXMBFR77_08810 [Phycisphaerales bacterium]|nr:MAG: hypothetical protein BroJett004_02590 [Planctomycetota bacterium]
MLLALTPESAGLRRDWCFFERVFVIAPLNEIAPHIEILEEVPDMAWHLRDMIQNAVLLRLTKLSDQSRSATSIIRAIDRLDKPTGNIPPAGGLRRCAQRLRRRIEPVKEHRVKRIAHTDPPTILVPMRHGDIRTARTKRLAAVTTMLVEKLVLAAGLNERASWSCGGCGSADEFLLLLKTFAAAHDTPSRRFAH